VLRVVAASLFLGLLVACGGDDGPEGDVPDGAELLERAAKTSAALRSFHFKLSHENGSTPLPIGLNLDLESAEGDVALPDRVAADLRADAGRIDVSVKAVAIGPDTWLTNPFTRQWQKLDADLRDFADLPRLLPVILPAVKDPRVTGVREVDGAQTYHVTGRLASADIQTVLPFALPNREVKIDAWVGRDDALPRRIRLLGPLIAGEAQDVVRQLDLSRFDEQVDIRPPR